MQGRDLEGLTWIEVADRLEALIAKMSPASQGVWEWGATDSLSDEQHVADFSESLAKTREFFKLEGDTKIHGSFVEGTDIKLAITGNSPNGEARAEYLSAVSPRNMTTLIAYIREMGANRGK